MESRQVLRHRLFVALFRGISNQHRDMGRKARRNLTRAYTSKAWKEESAKRALEGDRSVSVLDEMLAKEKQHLQTI